MDEPVRFGDRLRRARIAAGCSQEELAERAGLSANAISALERGERKRPFPDTVRRLTEALGLDDAGRAALAAAASGAPAPALTLPPPVAGLPAPPTPLVGRSQEIAVVSELLLRADTRLVTLTGAGGTGKTRLALEVATRLRDRFAGGACFVDLASIPDPALVLPTIASTLGVREGPGPSPSRSLAAHLAERPMLLVLDNFEHVLAAAPLVTGLLAASTTRVLVTSRVRLNLRAEQVVPVAPLPVPHSDHPLSPGKIGEFEAVQLFVQRARAARPDFALDATSAWPVAAICRRLDGLPLAIELAAARVRTLPPQAIAERLANRLRLLTGGAHDLPERQRTLRTTLEWSYGLLSDVDRALFRRLAIFAGGFTLDAAEAVAGMGGDLGIDVLDGVTELVDHSLLRQETGPDGESRFTMLEVLREFGLEHLEDTVEHTTAREAHVTWYVALAETAEPHLSRTEQVTWLARLEAEHDNFRAALGAVPPASEARLRLAGALWRFWYVRGYLREGSEWLASASDEPALAPPAIRARALHGAGVLAQLRGNLDLATTLYGTSLVILRELGEDREAATVLRRLGLVAAERGDHAEATARMEESLAMLRELNDPRGVAIVLGNLGFAAQLQGQHERAERLFAASLVPLREAGDHRGVATASGFLGSVVFDRGDTGRAVALLRESLMILRELSDTWGLARTLEIIASMAGSLGNGVLAARLLGAADTFRQRMGAPVTSIDRIHTDRTLAAIAAQLGEPALATIRASGGAMTLEESFGEALAFLDALERAVPGEPDIAGSRC